MSTTVFVDYYELLEIHPEASSHDIKAAYRAGMLRHHVDQNPDDVEAHERMILLSRAKAVLLDEHRRRAFDRERSLWKTAAAFGGGVPPRWTGGRAPDPSPFERAHHARGARHHVEVDLRDVSLTKLLVGAGVAAVVGGLAFAARTVADRANRKRRRR